jgi:hypothetical protein
MESATATVDRIPSAVLRAGYEQERQNWQMQLAQLQARLRAQQHISELLGANTTEIVAALIKDMELIATGLEMIEQLIMAVATDNSSANGREHA